LIFIKNLNAVILTTNLTLRDFSGIIEHFPVRGHIQGCGSTTF
jgi:hypothetical protein